MGKYIIKIGLLNDVIKIIASKAKYTELFKPSHCPLKSLDSYQKCPIKLLWKGHCCYKL